MSDQDLRVVGLNEDGTRLVLASDTGARFTVAVDAELRAALRGDHVRPGQLEKQMESALRPRDIQARIRAGESPESVADAAQTTLDRVMGYATPVLAERAHIAERAQRASIRRRAGEGSSRLLGDAVAERLRPQNVDPASVAWDAWRREDGRWTLVADYRVGGETKHAEFVFDAPGRYVVADDDEARQLVGEGPAVSPGAAAPPEPQTTGRRLAAVSDEELPLGDDAIGLVSEPDTDADEESTVDLGPAARAVRQGQPGQPGRPGHPAPPSPETPAGDGDWMATQATDRPPAHSGQPAAADERGAEPVAEQQPEAEEKPESGRKSTRRGRRASVPSWDEIMFGGGKRE